MTQEFDRDGMSSFDGVEAGRPLESGRVYFLYLVDPGDPSRDFGLVKVGVTGGDVERRIGQLQTGNPYQIRCDTSFESLVPWQVENWVHRAYASQVAHLEWLRLTRAEIPALAVAAQEQATRLAQIAEAKALWSRCVSNGEGRPPTSEESDIQREVQGIRSVLRRIGLELERIKGQIALRAGTVRRVPGVLTVRIVKPRAAFRSQLALQKFANVAAPYLNEEVRGTFHWRNRGKADSYSKGLKAEVEILKSQVRDLNTEILRRPEQLQDEGKRTDAIVSLHKQYLDFTQQRARLYVDEEVLGAQMIQRMEDFSVITGACSFNRRPKFVLGPENRESFRTNHPVEAAQCELAQPPQIHRTIFNCRSY
jgi:Meiotically up-regulated gene 113